MAYWVEKNWLIRTEADLNSYTFSVAGAVGLLICDIWTWFDGSQIDRLSAIHFGRGLQSVNILRNREEDTQRGVNFFPSGWAEKQMFAYARKNIEQAKAGIGLIPQNRSNTWWIFPWRLQKPPCTPWRTGSPSLRAARCYRL